MIIQRLVFLLNIFIIVCANDDQVVSKHNTSILFKRNIVLKSNNQISKLRLILISDIQKQNELTPQLNTAINCLSTSSIVNITTKSCPCNSFSCKNFSSITASTTTHANDLKRSHIQTSCYNVCCKAKKPSIRSIPIIELPRRKFFSFRSICQQNALQDTRSANNLVRIIDKAINDDICFGLLIHPKVVLTTAICIMNKKVSQIAIKNSGMQRNSSKIVLHEKFFITMDRLEHNIAIIFLEEEITHFKILPCLKKKPVDIDGPCFVNSFSKSNEVLFEVNDIEVVSPKVKCFNIHKNKRLKHEKYVNSGNLCAQQQSSSDIKINVSGAILTCLSKNIPTTIGLLTWSTNINTSPHLFTDLSEFVDWIEIGINKIFENIL